MRIAVAALSLFLLSTATCEAVKSISEEGRKNMNPWVLKCTDVPQFDALQRAAASFCTDEKLHLKNLVNDSGRCRGLRTEHLSPGGRRIILDYSRQHVLGETMELLFDLADAVGVTDRRAAMRCGHRINITEDRSVLHFVLRMPKGYDYADHPNGPEILKEVHQARDEIHDFTDNVRSGLHRGVTGKVLKNFLCIGIGGSYLGTECVYEALRADADAGAAAEGRTLRFIGNADPVDFYLATRDLDPSETLVIIVSKTFTTAETMLNAKTVRDWLLDNLVDDNHPMQDTLAKHLCAVSCNVNECINFGIPQSRVFGFWDWVGGRYSVWSAVGLVPLSLQYSYSIMEKFLDGAHDIDEHFFTCALRDNIPLILGLLGVWNSTFLGYGCRALLPYAQALKRFPAHVQQVDMESNGKRVALDGTPVLHHCGEIDFGEPGTNGQHSFYQLLHQGRVVPADFIGFMESQHHLQVQKDLSNHDELMCNFFAQPDTLASGKSDTELHQEAVGDDIRPHKVLPGNRPSSSILMTKLDAYAVGQLLAIYEHRTAVQGFLWGINSFDQYGVELGKHNAKQVRTQLTVSRKTGASVQGFNGSTGFLLDQYLKHKKKKM